MSISEGDVRLAPGDAHAARRARLGMPLTPISRVRLDLVGRRPAPRKVVMAPPIAPVHNFAPFNFLRACSPTAIIYLVALKHGLKYYDILGTSRQRHVVAARREAVSLVKSHCRDMSSVQLGRLFHKDHSSILNLLGRVKPSRRRPTDG